LAHAWQDPHCAWKKVSKEGTDDPHVQELHQWAQPAGREAWKLGEQMLQFQHSPSWQALWWHQKAQPSPPTLEPGTVGGEGDGDGGGRDGGGRDGEAQSAVKERVLSKALGMLKEDEQSAE